MIRRPLPAVLLLLILAPIASALGADAQGPVSVPAPDETTLRHYRSGNLLWIVETVWGLAVPALLLFTGFSARLRTWAQKTGRRWFFTVAIYAVLLSLVGFLMDLPLSYYAGFVRPHEYGLSNQTLGRWTGNTLKELGVGLVMSALFLWVPYLLLARSPRRWWLYTAILAVPLTFFMSLIYPVWIDPLFNHFSGMKDKALEARILVLADKAGISGARVYEVDKSLDTKTVNAYVTGLMDTKRIVLWDTIIAKLDGRELLCVVGHEMGHYVLGHVVQGLLLGSAGIFVVLYLIHRTAGWFIARFSGHFGFDRLSDVASLPLLSLIAGLFMLVVMPLVLAYSRHVEHEADRFGLEITRDNHAMATSFVKFQTEGLTNPRPGLLHKLWRDSHPPLGERVDFCNEYRPWEKGEPLRYAHLFKEPAHAP